VTTVISEKLLKSSRPGYCDGRKDPVRHEAVQRWIDQARAAGIASIICLLSDEHLCLYHDGPLLDLYQKAGFRICHIPTIDHRMPPLSQSQLDRILAAYRALPKPVLIHCSAGLGRTGVAVEFIREQEALHKLET
jgi:protein-tyrosine phosphatase